MPLLILIYLSYQGGMTPLHISSKKGINDVVVILLDEGADLHAKDEVM